MNLTNRGVVLILVFIIMVTLTAIATCFIYMTSIQTRGTGYDMDSHQALWLAEAGLQKYMFYLENGTYDADNHPDLTENLGEGSYTVEASYDEDTGIYTLTSTGTVDDVSRQITESVSVTSGALERALHADGAHLKFTNSSGTITGSVSCFVSVLPDPLPAGLTITGTVTEGGPKVNPSINMTSYYDLANALGQASTSNLTFSSGTYTGIWYTTKKATIESGATINGSVVAEGNIDFDRGANNVTINPRAYDPTKNYPALVSGGTVRAPATSGHTKIGLQNSTINGLILADNNIVFDYVQGTTAFTGTIIAGNNLEMENSTLNVTYDSTIFTPAIPGFTYTAGDASAVPQGDWAEVVPAT